jgi:hypothetical protein
MIDSFCGSSIVKMVMVVVVVAESVARSVSHFSTLFLENSLKKFKS